MSPEQAKGEGHCVDGRSDIFSLGVVLYELLTGRRPFRGDSTRDLLKQIKVSEPRPPRQIDDTIPQELENVCLKALAKDPPDRYSTAKDMADALNLVANPAGDRLDRQLYELKLKNEQLQAEMELQKEISTIDREWQDEREHHRVQYGKNSAAVEPSLGMTALFSVGSVVVMAIGLGMMSGSRIPEWFSGLWVLFGIGAPIYLIFKYVSFEQARKTFQLRRDAATRRFGERMGKIGAVQSQSPDPANAEVRISTVTQPPTTEDWPLPDAPAPAVAKKCGQHEGSDQLTNERAIGLIAFALIVILVSAFIFFEMRSERSSTAPQITTTPIDSGRVSKVPSSDQGNPAALVEHLASADSRRSEEAVQWLIKQREFAAETVPLLCALLEKGPTDLESAPLRQRIYSVLKAYGPAANDAAAVLATQFRLLSSSTAESETETEQIVETLQAIGPDKQVIAQLPHLLSEDVNDLRCVEAAHLIVLFDAQLKASEDEVPLSSQELARICRAVIEGLKVQPDADGFPNDRYVDVLVWVVGRASKLPADKSPLPDALAALHLTLQERIAEWNKALDTLENSAPSRTTGHSVRTGKRWRVIQRINPAWDQHQRQVKAARTQIEKCSQADQSIVAALNKIAEMS